MNDFVGQQQDIPENIDAINQSGFVSWSRDNSLSPDFKLQFDAERIPVLGIRQVKVWGLQVDDERALLGHERTSVKGEVLWEIVLEANDGSHYNVNSDFVVAAS